MRKRWIGLRGRFLGKTNAKSEDAEEHADGEDSLGWFWWSIKVSHGGVRGGDETTTTTTTTTT